MFLSLQSKELYLFTSRRHGIIITRKILGIFCLFLHKNKLKGVAIIIHLLHEGVLYCFDFACLERVNCQSSSNRLLMSVLFYELPVDTFEYSSSLCHPNLFSLKNGPCRWNKWRRKQQLTSLPMSVSFSE